MSNQKFISVMTIAIVSIMVVHSVIKNLLKEPIFISYEEEQEHFDSYNEDKNELMDYVHQHIDDVQKVDDYGVKGYNYYGDNAHTSSLASQESDLSQFFETERNEYNETLNEIKNAMHTNDGITKSLEYSGSPTAQGPDQLNRVPTNSYVGSDGSKAYKPDFWVYQNENTMNGGLMDGISGNDSMISEYAMYSDL